MHGSRYSCAGREEKFSEMCPIFKNTEISRDDIGDFIKAYAEEHKIMAQLRRSLISIWSMKGEKVLLDTPLLKWYLEHGFGGHQSTPSG